MNLDTYEREFGHDPESLVSYLFHLSERADRAEMILVSDPESLFGPFAGGYGLLVVRDNTGSEILPTINALRRLEAGPSYKHFDGPYLYEIADPSIERPVTIRLFGNDDFSWGVTVASLEVANKRVNELLALAPLTVQEIIEYCGMIFTN